MESAVSTCTEATPTSAVSGPVHVLMALSSSPVESREQQFKLDPQLQQDYIAKRRKAHGLLRSVKGGIDNTSSSSNADTTFHIWDGVSRLERSLVTCCEQPENPSVGSSESPFQEWGALEIDKEVRFAGLLARECHTMASRSLSLAILERTLETHLFELQEAKEVEQRLHEGDLEEEPDEQNADVAENAGSDEGEEDHAESPLQNRKRRSRRLRKYTPKYKRTKRKTDEDKELKEDYFDNGRWRRLEQFFAAGGLKILNRWLMDASLDEPILALKAPPGSNEKPQAPGLKPSTTRPLILPILRFLEYIPFDKNLVVDSKINKQIKKIEKIVDAILEDRARGKHLPDDLLRWTTEPTTAETDPLDYVKEAVDRVKKAWGERAKAEKDKFGDPFETLREVIAERLEALSEFEAGSTPRPDWLENLVEVKKENAVKSNMSSTQELAAMERHAEREEMQKRLRDAQDEHRKHVTRMRELRQNQDNGPSNRKKASGGKEVKWKDGLSSKMVRNRKILEETFVFIKDTPANRDMNEPVEDAITEADGRPEVTPSEEGNNETEGQSDVDNSEMTAHDSHDQRLL